MAWHEGRTGLVIGWISPHSGTGIATSLPILFTRNGFAVATASNHRSVEAALIDNRDRRIYLANPAIASRE